MYTYQCIGPCRYLLEADYLSPLSEPTMHDDRIKSHIRVRAFYYPVRSIVGFYHVHNKENALLLLKRE